METYSQAKPEDSAEVAIVGAGPIGLELAVGLKRAGVSYVQFDGRQIGHTISWFAPETRFFSSNERIAIAGVPLNTPDQTKCTREQYLAYLRGIVQLFDLKVKTYESVIGIERQEGGGFHVTTEGSSWRRQGYRVNKIVLATGGTAKPRRLNVPGEDLSHVSHYFKDPHTYFRKWVLIVGGRNSAVEALLRCHHAGAHVMLSYRRDKLDAASIKYWLMPEITGLIESKKVRAWFNTVPTEITPSHVTLEHVDGGRPQEVAADFVLLLVGYEADMALAKMAGVQLIGPQQVPVFNEKTMETNVPGVYLAGTVVGGTQEKYRVFIENCHVHVDRIVAALTGEQAPPEPVAFARPES
jgi:thioredoxin reductase (NADPH)